jgi:uncharacterized protein YfaS (alpha-2-macroglobulin family)
VAGTFTWNTDSTVLGFKPARTLEFGTRYTAAVAETARPANGGGHLRRAATHTFTTVSLPKIVRTEPRDGNLKADPGPGVMFQFAGPMDTASFVTGTYTILPQPGKVYTNYDEWENRFYLGFDKLPATIYTVTLAGRVADPYGNTLGQDYTIRFTTRNYDPFVALSSTDRVGSYNAYTDSLAIVSYRNVPEITFSLYRVSPAEFLALTGRENWEVWDKYAPKKADLVRQWSVPTDAPVNQTALVKEKLVAEDGTPPQSDGAMLPPGLYFLQLAGYDAKGSWRDSSRQLLARTSLNVTLKAAETEALAWVTDLKSGQPVPGVTVRFSDGADLDVTLTTDKDGVAQTTFATPRRPWDPLIALATGAAGEFGVASSEWSSGISSWDFDLPGSGMAEPYVAYVYTDRPIYRPGQTVYWKALIRRDNDALYALPAPGRPVTVTVQDSQGNELVNERKLLGPLGTVDGQLALALDASTGYYNVMVQLTEEARYGVGFQVAEYRKPEYEISAQTDRPEYIQGEQIKVTLQANYYFGGPVKNAKVNWVLLSNEYSFNWTGPSTALRMGYYSFSDWDWYDWESRQRFGGVLSQGEGITDDQGRFTFSVPADIARFPQSQTFTFDLTVLDVNNQVVSTQATAVVHKGAFYIGLRPQSYVSTVGEPSLLDVLTVPSTAVAGLPTEPPTVPDVPVTLVVNQMTWYSVREQAENGQYYWTSKVKKTPVYTETLTTGADATAVFKWIPAEGGEYKVEAIGRDKAGHVIRSAAYVWVSGRDYVNWRQENNDRIELVADKQEYTVGDTAEILVASPYQGKVKALLTVERNHILRHQVIELQGNSELVRIPIEPAYAPDVFVSLILVKGMDASPLGGTLPPSFKMGLAQLKVSVADKELKVILTPHKTSEALETSEVTRTFGPREKVVWDVQTLDTAGKPIQAEVSLALVDKAVLALAADQAGKLMDRFYSQRGLGVRTASTLVVNIDRVVAQLAAGGKGGGGGGELGEGGLSVRREFPDVAYWNAIVTTDADGKAQVEVTLPDNLTTWTMDARAITADTLVGQATADIVTTKELLVRPVLPRFFIAGDQAEIAAVIHNNTPNALDVTINLAATGLNLAGAVAGLPTEPQKVAIPAESVYKAVWPVTVQSQISGRGPDAQETRIQMSAIADQLSDAVEITLPVYRYSTPEVVGTAGQVALDESRLELVRLPADADPSRGELDVKLEPSLAAGMTGGLTYLEHFPYECIEQTMSRFLPNVVSYDALKRLGVKRPDPSTGSLASSGQDGAGQALETRLPQMVGVGLQRIYARQHIDGGWGWWPKDASDLYISAYVVFGLARARQAGFAVDQDVLERGIRFVKRGLKAPSDLKGNKWQLNRQAFALYALAEAGELLPNRAGALFEAREGLDLYAKAYLALALALINDGAGPERIRALLADVTGKAIVSATATHWEEGWTDYWNMNTDTRTTSVVLDALAKLDPTNSLAPNAVRWLMSARKADRWETTQENVWAIIALTDWMAATGELEGNYDWRVFLNNAVWGEGSVTPDKVGEAIALTTAVGATDTPPLLADQTNGLLIQRSLSPSGGKSGDQTGKGQLYYTVYLKAYLPVEKVEPLNRGVIVGREYRLAECGSVESGSVGDRPQQQCPAITQARVGDVINVKLTIVAPHDLQYLVVEDPLPAGTEAIDTSLRTTSVTAQGPELQREEGPQARPWWYWWWVPTHVDLRDEKVALFATDLPAGSYEFTYQIRASLPGRFLTLPPTAYQMYFPEVWGRGAGSVFTVLEGWRG